MEVLASTCLATGDTASRKSFRTSRFPLTSLGGYLERGTSMKASSLVVDVALLC